MCVCLYAQRSADAQHKHYTALVFGIEYRRYVSCSYCGAKFSYHILCSVVVVFFVFAAAAAASPRGQQQTRIRVHVPCLNASQHRTFHAGMFSLFSQCDCHVLCVFFLNPFCIIFPTTCNKTRTLVSMRCQYAKYAGQRRRQRRRSIYAEVFGAN